MPERLVSEAITPVKAAMDAARTAPGAPVLPRRFLWRDREYAVAEVIKVWRETGPCASGSPEQYVRRHWFAVRCADGTEMKLYFERKARSRRDRTRRWWLYTVGK